jgi:WhiB family redox-sensing transcriptional regulator
MTAIDKDLILDLLSTPLADEKPWATYASCQDANGMTFFPQTKAETQAALTVCAGCPVRAECLDHALATNERFGVWGGTTEKERRLLARGA